MTRVRLASLAASSLAALVAACSGDPGKLAAPPTVATASAEEDPCALARTARERVPGLLAQGQLHRALHVMQNANEACPADAPSKWADEITTLADLGRWADVRRLAAEIAASFDPSAAARAAAATALDRAAKLDVEFPDTDDAKAAMRKIYFDAAAAETEGKLEDAARLYLAAWEAWRPNGQALVQAGLVQQKLDHPVDAQRLFDRGIAELERATGARVVLETPNGFGEILATAWSSRGRIALARGNDVLVVSQSSLREVSRFEGHIDRVTAIAFSADGKILASGGDDNTVRVWDVESGKLRARIALPMGARVAGVALAPDGAFVVAGTPDHGARMSTTETGQPVWSADVEHGAGVAFSPDGKTVALCSYPDGVRLLDASTGKVTRSLGRQAQAVQFSPDGRLLLASTLDDGAILDVATGNVVMTIDGPPLAFSPDGARVVARGTQMNDVQMWDVASKKPVFYQSAQNATSAAFSPDGRSIAVAQFDGTLTLRSSADGRTLRASGLHTGIAARAATSPDGRWLGVTLGLAGMRLWDFGDAAVTRFDAEAFSVAFSPRSDLVYAQTRLYALPGGEPVAGRTRSEGRVAVLDATELVGVRDDHAVRLDVAERSTSLVFEGDGKIEAFALSPDQKVLAAAIPEVGIRLWDVASGKTRATLAPLDGRAVAFSTDGMLVAGAGVDDVVVWDVESGAVVQRLPGCPPIAFSTDSAVVVTGSLDGAEYGSPKHLDVWELATAKKLKALPTNLTWVVGAGFVSRGELLASTSSDGTQLFRASSLDLVATLRSVAGIDAAYVFTPSGAIAFAGKDADAVRDLPVCRVGAVSVPFAVCRARFEVPDLLERVVKNRLDDLELE